MDPILSITPVKVRPLREVLPTPQALAAHLGMPLKKLHWLLYAKDAEKHYRTFSIAKRSGGSRAIHAPIRPLKEAQRAVASLLDAHYRPRSCVFGYVEGRNTIQNATKHSGKRWVLRVDLADFFPTINFGRVLGLLRAEPFLLPSRVAVMVAQICCHGGALPQGSPASPVISNLICRGLDHTLLKLARRFRCSVTRYCDDIVISTNRREFPAELASREGRLTTLGPELEACIKSAGFLHNENKTRLRDRSQRQLVTGLVTNARVNVTREYVRGLRMVLYVWRRYGMEKASAWYFSNHDKKHRPAFADPQFANVIHGKVQYVGAVRGWQDPTYNALATMLSNVDNSFEVAAVRKPVAPEKPLQVYVEGPTDITHIQTALAALQRAGEFKDLDLRIEHRNGSTELKKHCIVLAGVPQVDTRLFLFDSDEPEIIKEMSNNGEPKVWSKNVVSVVLPPPPHRDPAEPLCVELLYLDVDLERPDPAGRRLFRSAEFDRESGRHLTLNLNRTQPKHKSLVVEKDVFDGSHQQVALSKAGFAKLIEQSEAVCFDGFIPLFELLRRVRVEYEA